jgi:integrase
VIPDHPSPAPPSWHYAGGARSRKGERDFLGTDYPEIGYVFTNHDGRPPHPDTIRQRFDRLVAAAGLPRRSFHDLRHSYATGALRAGVSPKFVSERIGQVNVGFCLRRTPTNSASFAI